MRSAATMSLLSRNWAEIKLIQYNIGVIYWGCSLSGCG